MVKLIALDTVFGDYRGGRTGGVRAGLIHKGEHFEASDQDAERLESRGIAMRYFEPAYVPPPVESFMPRVAEEVRQQTATYETKVIVAETQHGKFRNKRK